ncbi:MAG TPA: S8/S53 family peptidase [Trueperaceae bacterium]|nr:S8/S53 family peptidase [Trueperaceae bacterium]
MRRLTAILTPLLAAALLAGCAHDPSASPAGMTTVVLSTAAVPGLGPLGVPTRPGGAGAVTHVEVTVYDRRGDLVTFDADNVHDPDGDVAVLMLGPGATSVTVKLLPGRYTFRTVGSEGPGGQVLAYGETVATVTHASTTVDLELSTLLGAADLVPDAPRRYVKPGEVLDLYLVVRTVGGAYLVPVADYEAEYALDDDLGTFVGSPLGVRVDVTPAPTRDRFVMRATARGWGLKDGAPAPNRRLTATFERPFLHTAGLVVDVLPPTLVLDAPPAVSAGQTALLTGTADDDVGVARVLVFEGPVLIGSSSLDDVGDGVGHVAFTDLEAGAWELAWQPPAAGAYAITVVAIDTSGNETRVGAELLVGAGSPPPGSVGELKSVSGGEPLDETLGNCAATELSLPGQGLQAIGAGLQAIGAVGGLLLGPTEGFAGATTTAAKVAAEVEGVTGPMPYHARVAVLVVDEFAGVYDLPSELTSGSPLTLDQLEALAADGRLTHGALVLRHLLAMLAATHGPYVVGSNGLTGEPLYRFGGKYSSDVAVQTVDTAGRDTTAIVAAVRESLAYLSRKGELGYTDFVVNMSFAVVPCAVAADLGASDVTTFEDYVTAVRLVNGIGAQYEDEVAGLLTTPLGAEDDALLAFLDCPLPGEKYGLPRCDGGWAKGGYVLRSLVNVASAGNLGHDFALYPAAWPTVISVSSLDVVGDGYSPSRSGYANSGEVAAPGALFALSATDEDQVVAYAGTSFSAPVVTLFTAFDLASGPRCDPGDLTSTPATAPALAHGAYANTPLDAVFGGAGSAIDVHCGG